MSGGSLPQPRFELRWLFGSPLLSAACVVALCACAVLARALDALVEADRLRQQAELCAVQLAAEAAAERFVTSAGHDARGGVDVGRGVAVRTTAHALGDREVALAAELGGVHYRFRFPVLDGAAPELLGRPLSVLDEAAPWPEGWPRPFLAGRDQLPAIELDGAAVVQESRAALHLERDPGIALLRLPVGTDRPDFVFAGGGAGPLRFDAPPAGVVVVDGNLWVDKGRAPLRLALDDNLTVMVRGNLYLGRSVEVVGDGCLTFVALCVGGVGLLDRDGNGRWSRGDEALGQPRFAGVLEGAGNVYLGLPGQASGELQLDCGLVVRGGLHVGAARAVVHGPLVLEHGGAVLPGRPGDLVASGRRLPELQRSVLPGFAVAGGPRPGALVRERRPGQALYPAGPTR